MGAFWGENPTDRESIKSTLWVDSSDQIQIRIFEIRNLSGFFSGSILNKWFSEQKWYTTDAVHI